ncbi:multicopper oxidase domain-containing protein [Streptomyces sp. NPDC096176]|uniref:multicopper oxidase domain-containing protein n=1 Tax=Streptomyces sp. NPDC096176 TaxID=3366079 RepID=UPI003824E52F
MSGINGRPMTMDRIDETVTRGAAETWTVRNQDGVPHNFPVHEEQFRVLAVDGRRRSCAAPRTPSSCPAARPPREGAAGGDGAYGALTRGH